MCIYIYIHTHIGRRLNVVTTRCPDHFYDLPQPSSEGRRSRHACGARAAPSAQPLEVRPPAAAFHRDRGAFHPRPRIVPACKCSLAWGWGTEGT